MIPENKTPGVTAVICGHAWGVFWEEAPCGSAGDSRMIQHRAARAAEGVSPYGMRQALRSRRRGRSESGAPGWRQRSRGWGVTGLESPSGTGLAQGRFAPVAGAGPRVGPPELKTAPPGGGAVFSAGDRTRTGTRLPARDFKSLVSTIPPHRHGSNTISRRGKGVKPSRAEKRCKPGGKKGQPG